MHAVQTRGVGRRQSPARKLSRVHRRLASRAARVTTWWAAVKPVKPQYMTPLALTLSIGLPMQRIAAALYFLGWKRIVRRVHGKQVTLWLPPNSTIKTRPVGRPRSYAD